MTVVYDDSTGKTAYTVLVLTVLIIYRFKKLLYFINVLIEFHAKIFSLVEI